MRLQETHPQRKQREFRPCRPKTGVFRQTSGNASNAGSPANRGVQGKEKPNRDLLGLVDMVDPLGFELKTKDPRNLREICVNRLRTVERCGAFLQRKRRYIVNRISYL